MKRGLWTGHFVPEHISGLPCPRCQTGKLGVVKETVKTAQPHHSSVMSEMTGSPEDETWRFMCLLKCDQMSCGELVTVCGDVDLVDDYEEECMNWRPIWLPRAMLPGPPLLKIPKATPKSIVAELRLSFELFWLDFGSCANRLRISLERLLDEFGIPKGKLQNRITKFSEAYPDHARLFDALRHVGNAGSHEGAVKRDTLLDAFEVYEYALDQLYGGEKSRIEHLKKRILTALGK